MSKTVEKGRDAKTGHFIPIKEAKGILQLLSWRKLKSAQLSTASNFLHVIDSPQMRLLPSL